MKKQNKKDRMDESKAMRKGSNTFGARDGRTVGETRQVNMYSEKYDLGKVRPAQDDSRGYPAEAWRY